MRKLAVVGAGSWGTIIASLAAVSTPTTLWARRDDLARVINEQRENADYMPGHRLPYGLVATSDMESAVTGAEVILMAVPSHGFRAVLEQVGEVCAPGTPVVSLTKGIEQGTLAPMTRVISEVLPDLDPRRIGVLTGPNLAAEIAAGQPTATVVALRDEEVARAIQETFMGPTFRVYTNDDVTGCELGGALKNVMAIAAGMSDGLGFGDNTKATLITRALAELTRLGVALGGRSSTFAGLAGMGDLLATCMSAKSRNHRVGVELATGKPLDDIIEEMNMVAEGVKTTRSVLDLADGAQIEMPIATHVGRVLYEGLHPRDAVIQLMTRDPKAEL